MFCPEKKIGVLQRGLILFPILILLLLFLHFLRLIYLATTNPVFQVCENNPLPVERMWQGSYFLRPTAAWLSTEEFSFMKWKMQTQNYRKVILSLNSAFFFLVKTRMFHKQWSMQQDVILCTSVNRIQIQWYACVVISNGNMASNTPKVNSYFCRKYSFCYLFSGTWWFLHYQTLTDIWERSKRK